MTKIKNVYFKNIKIRGILKAENDKINYENKIFLPHGNTAIG